MKIFKRFFLVFSVGISLIAVTIFNIERNSIYIGGTHYHGTPSDTADNLSADIIIDSPKHNEVVSPSVSPASKVVSNSVLSLYDTRIHSASSENILDTPPISIDSYPKAFSFTEYLKNRNDKNIFDFTLDSSCTVKVAFTASGKDNASYKLTIQDP